MRVVVFGPTYPLRGGISHFTTLMVENMRGRHDVLFLSYLKQYPEFLYPGRTQIDGSEEHVMTQNDPVLSFANPASWHRAARKAVEHKPDLVIFSWVSPALAVQFRYISGFIRNRCPMAQITFVCHNVVQHEERAIDVFLARFAFKQADSFIVHGEGLKSELGLIKPGADVSVTHHPTYEHFASREISSQSARSELGIPPGVPLALYFGFVRPYKGLRHLIDAIPAAFEAIGSLEILIVGEFWGDRDEYLERIEETGFGDRVTVRDEYVPNEEVGLYFSAADIVVLPYTTASASGIIQVAYGFGKPVVTTTVGSLPEVVREGKTGYLVPPGDHRALAGAIIRFFREGDSSEFERNIEEFRPRFSWDRYTEVLENTCRRS